jgi:cytochrome b6-f complex iron-sulfur subunit
MAQAAAKTPTPAAGKAGAAEPPKVQGVTRREFLNYIWGASMALALAQTAGAIVWYILPVFKAGEFGGAYTLDIGLVPPPDSGPAPFPALRFWLVNIGDKGAQVHAAGETAEGKTQTGQEGLIALYTVCTHLGCLYKWVDINNRFECPCHGSKYNLNGTYIEGPTPRNLDRMIMRFLDAGGKELAATDKATGAAVPMPPSTAQIVIETGKIVRGFKHD